MKKIKLKLLKLLLNFNNNIKLKNNIKKEKNKDNFFIKFI